MSSVMLSIVVVVAVLVFVAALTATLGRSGTISFPYQPAKALFSAAERSFLGVLDQAVGPEHRVFGKVRVADVATVKPGLGASARQAALNRIAAKHLDFVVCRASDLVVVCAVELNDKSHASQRAQSRDDLLRRVTDAMGLPLLTVPAQHAYSVQDIRSRFLAAVAPPSQELPSLR